MMNNKRRRSDSGFDAVAPGAGAGDTTARNRGADSTWSRGDFRGSQATEDENEKFYAQAKRFVSRFWVIGFVILMCIYLYSESGDGLALDSREWIAMHSRMLAPLIVLPEFQCQQEFNPSWIPAPHVHDKPLPFTFWYSDVCFRPRADLPLEQLGTRLMEQYSWIGDPGITQSSPFNLQGKRAWSRQITELQSLQDLFSAKAWLKANGNIFETSADGPPMHDLFSFGAEPIYSSSHLEGSGSEIERFLILVEQAYYTLKIESSSRFWISDVERFFSTSRGTFVQDDLNILNSFVDGMKRGFVTLYHMPISEWNLVHLANIHRVVCKQLRPPDQGFIRTDGLMKTGERVCAPTGWEVPHLMTAYVNWLHFTARRVERGCMHPLRFAFDAYINLLLIHPWADCNGRLSRIVMIFILIKYGYPPPALEMFAQDSLLEVLNDIQEAASIGQRQALYTRFALWVGQAVSIHKRRHL